MLGGEDAKSVSCSFVIGKKTEPGGQTDKPWWGALSTPDVSGYFEESLRIETNVLN